MTIKTVKQEQIDIELKSSYKPLSIESAITILPFSDLGDREFELLTYTLVKAEIEDSIYPGISNIVLMQGVAERGRDCILYNNETICGVIQCKKYTGRLSRPQIIKELIKFILFSLLDKSILPDPDNFEYKIYASNDFTEPANKLIYSYQEEIKKEIESKSIEKYMIDTINDYESFSVFRTKQPLDDIIKLLHSIKITSSNSVDLTARMHKYKNLLSLFFNIKSIIDLPNADKIIRNALEDYGLKMMTDNDLKVIQNRIGKTKQDNRVNLGFVDFFGYNAEFFKSLKENFKPIAESLINAKSSLDKYQMDYIISKIDDLSFTKVTVPLLHTGKIHPFSVGIVKPYLVQRLTMNWVACSLPRDLLKNYYPQFGMTKQDLINDISNTLYTHSNAVMSGDYSNLVGDATLVSLKIRLYKHMHTGLNNIEDAKTVFNNDIKIIFPVLEDIEKILNEEIPRERTIIIKDSSFFDNDNELEMVATSIKKI